VPVAEPPRIPDIGRLRARAVAAPGATVSAVSTFASRHPSAADRVPWVLRRWPTALGLAAAAAALLTVADRNTAATCVGVAVLCYLGAAALGRPWIAWAGVLGGSVMVTVGEVLDVGRWAVLAAAGVVLVAVGLVVGVPRRPVLVQALASVVFGGLALGALALDPRTGLVVAGLVLAAHAGWDVVHHRRRAVVPRSLAEACLALDLLLGLGVALIGLTT
jgi:hypothetical protein